MPKTIEVRNDLFDRLFAALPQTQCTKCGYPDCKAYARAMATGEALHNQCPPGGQKGTQRLAKILSKESLTLNPANGDERPRSEAVIESKACIGCTLCIQACPVDAIVGAPKQMHVVLKDWCTGCDLCIPPCPVDCITMISVTGNRTGWDAWTEDQAKLAKDRYETRQKRLEREELNNRRRFAVKVQNKAKAFDLESASTDAEKTEIKRKHAIIAAAMARAKKLK